MVDGNFFTTSYVINFMYFVAEELRENKEWLDIPVVVITAKDLTSEDHNRLKGNVEAIMQKGSYTKNELLTEVGDRIKKLSEWLRRFRRRKTIIRIVKAMRPAP